MILTPLLPYIVTFVAPIGLVTIQQTRTVTVQPTESRVYKNDLKAHFFFPKGWKASDKRPAIVLFHGGGWTGGNPGTLYSQAAAAASAFTFSAIFQSIDWSSIVLKYSAMLTALPLPSVTWVSRLGRRNFSRST